MAAYIKGAAVISPQKTFGIQGFPDELISFSQVDRLKCIEPAYRDFIDPMVSRRMSRIVKMGVCAALQCIRETGIQMPDGIIAGTGLGCLEDTEKFLASIYNNDEKLLNPTPFIQSTHNTVAGAIALAIKCHNYNATYTHRGFSFESAVEDALLLLAEEPGLNILAGGFDELTDTGYHLTKRLGLWRKALPGEGVAFFMLGGQKGKHDLARLMLLKTFYKPQDTDEINNTISLFLSESHQGIEDVDLVILGLNGNDRTDHFYLDLIRHGVFDKSACVGFKQLCGEYDTSSSFALWMASTLFRQQSISLPLLNGRMPEKLDHILIYNHLRGVNHSLYLLERC
jgi:hypothetical protein